MILSLSPSLVPERSVRVWGSVSLVDRDRPLLLLGEEGEGQGIMLTMSECTGSRCSPQTEVQVCAQ